jgi:hypothetical protein
MEEEKRSDAASWRRRFTQCTTSKMAVLRGAAPIPKAARKRRRERESLARREEKKERKGVVEETTP